MCLLALAVAVLTAACSGAPGAPDTGPLATRVSQLDQRVKRLELMVQTPEALRTPEPSGSPAPGATTGPRATPPVPLATLTARIASGGFTLLKEWQADSPKRLESFNVTAPWVMFWTLANADPKAPLVVHLYRVAESQPFTTLVESGVDGEGREIMFDSGSFQIQVSGRGTWQLRIANFP